MKRYEGYKYCLLLCRGISAKLVSMRGRFRLSFQGVTSFTILCLGAHESHEASLQDSNPATPPVPPPPPLLCTEVGRGLVACIIISDGLTWQSSVGVFTRRGTNEGFLKSDLFLHRSFSILRLSALLCLIYPLASHVACLSSWHPAWHGISTESLKPSNCSPYRRSISQKLKLLIPA